MSFAFQTLASCGSLINWKVKCFVCFSEIYWFWFKTSWIFKQKNLSSHLMKNPALFFDLWKTLSFASHHILWLSAVSLDWKLRKVKVCNLGQNIWGLCHFLAQFFFTKSETELDYYYQKVSVRVASWIAERKYVENT